MNKYTKDNKSEPLKRGQLIAVKPTPVTKYECKNTVAIKLKDGTIISLSDLPPDTTTRWVASAKVAIIRVFMAGLISKSEVIKRYGLSDEEFTSWLDRYISGGNQALKITKLREYHV